MTGQPLPDPPPPRVAQPPRPASPSVPGQVPVIEADVPATDVPMQPRLGELGAHAFARDIAVWLSRIFDAPVEALRYRENPWDHRPCLRAQTYETLLAGHTILVTSFDVPMACGLDTVTAHAISVDHGADVPFTPRNPALHLAWQLAWAAWRAAGPS